MYRTARAGRRRRSLLVAGLGVAVTGDLQGKVMTEQQPMKMAAAEALYDTADAARRSRSSPSARLDGQQETFAVIEVPGLLSFLATGDFDGEVEGINDLRAQYEQTYGQDPGATYYSPGDYTPIIPVTYWTLPADDRPRPARAAASRSLVLWLTRKRPRARPSRAGATGCAIALPLLPARSPTPSAGSSPRWAASRGSVFGLMTTAQRRLARASAPAEVAHLADRASPCSTPSLAVVEVGLMLRYVRPGRRPVRASRPTPTGRRGRRRPPARLRRTDGRRRAMELTTVWFVLIAVLWIGYFVLEGFDFGVGMLLPVLGRRRDRAPGPDQHHRPGLGRQRGLAARRRRRDVRGVPGVVRDAVQRLLPAAAADPGRPDRARASPSSTARKRRRRAVAARAGTPRSSSARSCPRCCGAWRSPTSCAASRSTRDKEYTGGVLQPAQPVRAARRARPPCCCSSPTARSSSR